MSGNYIYKTKSKSRTFKKNGDPGELYHWVFMQIKAYQKEYEGTCAQRKPTAHLLEKYIITVTKVIDDDPKTPLP